MSAKLPPPASSVPTPPASNVHQPPPGAPFMNTVRWGLFVFLVLLAVVSIGSYVVSRRSHPAAKEAAGQVVWHCPMHPSYTSDKPGECPICGMTLEPVVMGADSADHAASAANGDVAGLTTVTITPERIQLIGVRTARVERSSVSGQLDLVGFVAPDESRIKRVQIRVSGWIRELYVNQTGFEVRAGQPLMSIYSPELFQSEQEYLINQGGMDSTMHMSQGGSGAPSSERLRLLGVPDEELRRLEREGTASTQLVLRSPVSGTVLERGVVEGQYVSADTPLLTVADLSRVWVVADLYEMDMTRVHAGDLARFTSDAMPTRSFSGRVDFVYPTVSSETRTLKARLALDNPNGMLRPGMYGRVSVSAGGARALSVPAEAVVNTGEHSYVFLAHPGGRFEPRLVWTGPPEGDRIQILKGVAEGDTVVSSASFLIDSESRLRAAIRGQGAQPGAMDHGGQP
ncbi:MAG: efflux RND transporter periplasmic adaptor subunit [Candidatus Eiseniibacteriota bacterium]